jgi:hypothetical protein
LNFSSLQLALGTSLLQFFLFGLEPTAKPPPKWENRAKITSILSRGLELRAGFSGNSGPIWKLVVFSMQHNPPGMVLVASILRTSHAS